jgi:hypothetical protein
MADSIRKLILMDIEEALKTAPSLETIVTGRPEHFNFARPIAGFFPANEDTELYPAASELNVLDFIVRVLVDEEDQHALYELEDALADVEAAVKADTTRSGLAEYTHKTGVKYLYVDAELPRAGADLMFSTRYATEESDPSHQNME